MKELCAGHDLLPIDDANSLAARVTQAVQELQLEGEAVSVFNVQCRIGGGRATQVFACLKMMRKHGVVLPASGHGLQVQSAIEALRDALADLPD